MKNRDELPDRLIIHCSTKKVAEKVVERLHDLGYMWCDGSICSQDNTYWDLYREDTCYCKLSRCISIHYKAQFSEYRIITGEEFLIRYTSGNNVLRLKKLSRIKLKFTL